MDDYILKIPKSKPDWKDHELDFQSLNQSNKSPTTAAAPAGCC